MKKTEEFISEAIVGRFYSLAINHFRYSLLGVLVIVFSPLLVILWVVSKTIWELGSIGLWFRNKYLFRTNLSKEE